ncbi:unnamed protein product [Musa acuminata var. zebrina]
MILNFVCHFAGPDDMPAHIKSSMFGCSLTIPITDGRLNMGTWQVRNFILPMAVNYRLTYTSVMDPGFMHLVTSQEGIWLCEHRDHATARKVVITLNGMSGQESKHHDLEFVEAEHAIAIEVKGLNHPGALVDGPRLAEAFEHSTEARGGDASLPFRCIHPEGIPQVPPLLHLPLRLHQLHKILHSQQPIAVGVARLHRGPGVLR